MLVGRFLMIIPLLAMAGALVRKKLVPVSAGTLATDTALFAVVVVAVVIVMGAIEYLPALALGPAAEHFQMVAGRLL
jgi:K+-transporting ATPase ATPase A chain